VLLVASPSWGKHLPARWMSGDSPYLTRADSGDDGIRNPRPSACKTGCSSGSRPEGQPLEPLRRDASAHERRREQTTAPSTDAPVSAPCHRCADKPMTRAGPQRPPALPAPTVTSPFALQVSWWRGPNLRVGCNARARPVTDQLSSCSTNARTACSSVGRSVVSVSQTTS
jgi:hypothetical protein